MCLYMYIYIYMCVCVNMYLYIYYIYIYLDMYIYLCIDICMQSNYHFTSLSSKSSCRLTYPVNMEPTCPSWGTPAPRSVQHICGSFVEVGPEHQGVLAMERLRIYT